MNEMSGEAPRQLLGIQAARGVAAFLVVLSHAEHMLALPQYVGFPLLDGIFGFGHAGVDFFFVLSGFIIFFVHHADLGKPSLFGRYAKRRLTRIYPIYWVVTAVVIVLALFSPERAERLEPVHVLASLLLLPHGQDPLLGVAWTLQHEMPFYLFFGAMVLSRRIGGVLFGIWALMVLAQTVFQPSNPVFGFIGGSYHIQFFMGIFAAWLVLTDRVPVPLTLATLGAVMFLAVGVGEQIGWVPVAKLTSQLLFGSASTMVVAGLAAAERMGRLSVGKVAAFLGGTSYSLYLVHTIAIGLTAKVLSVLHLFNGMPDWLAMSIVSASAVLAGSVVHVWIELPLLKALRPSQGRRLSPVRGASGPG